MGRSSRTFLPGFILRFLATETAAGAACVAAIVLAMVWANSPWHGSYTSFWHTRVTLGRGTLRTPETLAAWISEGAMVVFFFVVGLEVKRELLTGELRHWKAAALPVLCAVAGMVVPAAIYWSMTAGTDARDGWAIPMATDLAVAVAVIAALASRVPPALKVFLLTLAIADDIGAVVVIATFFTDHLDFAALGVAVVAVGAIAGLSRSGRQLGPLIVALAVGAWLATLRSGVHPTVAGVAIAFALPTGARSERLEERVHPVASLVIVPLFVVASAGVRIADASLSSAAAGRIALAVGVSLVVGKTLGVAGAAWILVKLRVGRLPDGVAWGQVAGLAVLCGIGLTVAVLVADLALTVPAEQAAAKIGVLGASTVAGCAGAAVLALSARRQRRGTGQVTAP